MKRSFKWILAALVLALLFTGILRAVKTRQSSPPANSVTAPTASTHFVELARSDVMQVKITDMDLSLPISGSLRASHSAFVKARVAGELQGLIVREGDRVQAGQSIARIDPTESQARLRQAEQQAQAAKAQLDIAQRQFDDNQALVGQGFISKTALSNSQNNLKASQANLEAAQAAVALTRKALDDTELRAPMSGQVAQRLAQPGERLAVDTRVIEIVDLAQLELEANLNASEASELRPGQTASLQVEGVNEQVTARVLRINPSAQPGSRAVVVYLGLQNICQRLRQGQFAEGRIKLGQSQGLAIPLSAVRTEKPRPYVQTVEQDRVMHREVTLGARGEIGGEPAVLVEGLPEDSLILRGHLGALRAGMEVKYTASATTAPGTR